jgi:predicted nucleic acid-binding protein
VSHHLLDTSVIIAERAPALPASMAMSVITIGELRSGVLLASDRAIRAQRGRKLARAQAAFIVLDVDSRVAEHYADALAFARRERRIENRADLLIVATAAAHGRTLFTLDSKQGRLARDLGVAVEVG